MDALTMVGSVLLAAVGAAWLLRAARPRRWVARLVDLVEVSSTDPTPVLLVCPWCGLANNHAEPVPGPQRKMRRGELAICFVCRQFGVARRDGSLRRASSVEIVAALEDPGVRLILHAMAESYTFDQAVDLLRRTGDR